MDGRLLQMLGMKPLHERSRVNGQSDDCLNADAYLCLKTSSRQELNQINDAQLAVLNHVLFAALSALVCIIITLLIFLLHF